MRDGDVREVLYRRLRMLHRDEPDTRYVDELDLCGTVRVDVAVVNGYIAGYELKSASDSLRRLPVQVEYYSRVVDYATLVVATKHHEKAAKDLPEWWGVLIAEQLGSGEVVLHTDRYGQLNSGVDPVSLAMLLWRDEALEELTTRGLDRSLRSKPRRVLWEHLACSVPITELQKLTRDRLKARTGWRPDQ
jgi:hypothetical protein